LDLVGILVESGVKKLRKPKGPSLRMHVWQLLGSARYQTVMRAYYGLAGFVRLRLGRPTLEQRVRRVERRLETRANREFRKAVGGRDKWPRSIPRRRVDKVNDRAGCEWCRSLEPDLFLVFETSILKADMIRVPRLGILNLHPALLPDYRGVRCEFWQILNDQLEHAGVTVHFIDEGVDTGDIVLQERAVVRDSVDHYELRSHNTLIGADLMIEAAKQILTGSARPFPQGPSATPVFRWRDYTLDKRRELLAKLGYAV
jgi:hypothetical protein